MSKGFIIAIDGPVASGKGTIAKALSKKLNAFFLTTGMFYRAATYYCLQHKINLLDAEAVRQILPDIQVTVRGETTLLNNQDVTRFLKLAEVDKNVPIISNYSFVREYLTPTQRQTGLIEAKKRVVIAEGRDMATKVFPDATVKIYLTASVKTRAQRRFEQQKTVRNLDFQTVLAETKQRDYGDMYGEMHYLTTEPEKYGYTIVDDTDLTEEQTIERILEIVRNNE